MKIALNIMKSIHYMETIARAQILRKPNNLFTHSAMMINFILFMLTMNLHRIYMNNKY